MNCFALTYGPIYSVYSGSGISDYSSGKLIGKSFLYYFAYALTKMILYATVIPIYPSSTDDNFNITQESFRALVNSVEIIFIFYLLKTKNTTFTNDQVGLKVVTISIGWCLADSLCTYLFYFLMNATGEEFTWEYIQAAIESNIDFIEKICIIGLIESIQNLSKENKVNIHYILLLLGKYVFNAFGFEHIQYLRALDQWEKIIAKGVITLVFGIISRILFRIANKTDEEKATEAYYKSKKTN